MTRFSLPHWLDLFTRASRSHKRWNASSGRRRWRPQLEALEDRFAPAVIAVMSLADSGPSTLRQAIIDANAAPGDDIINIGVTGTISLAGVLPDLRTNIIIQGVGGKVTVRRDTGGEYRIFTVASGATIVLSGLTVSNGLDEYQAGGGIYNGGTLSVYQATISGNAGTQGGGIYNTGTLTVTESTLSGNDCFDIGGGIYNKSGTVTVNASTLSGNDGPDGGGGIYNQSGTVSVIASTLSENIVAIIGGGGIYNQSGTVTVTASTLSGNNVWWIGQGGGIFNQSGAVTVSNSTLSGNSAEEHGGGGIYNQSGLVTVTNSTLSNNHAPDGGAGAGINNAGTLIVDGCTFSMNDAVLGGGIYNFGTATITVSTLASNNASSGGGVYNDGTLNITNSTISSNSVHDNGGGIDNVGALTVSTCTFSMNGSFNEGGGIFNAGAATITASTFTRNYADWSGGGLYNVGMLTLSNSTVSGNSVADYWGFGGGIGAEGPTSLTIITSSTIWGNMGMFRGIFSHWSNGYAALIAGNNIIQDITGDLGSVGHNLIGDTRFGSGFFPTDLGNIDAKLSPLQDNGGPTLTLVPLPGSPAIDAGVSDYFVPATDQRGLDRVGIVDIGAVERQAPTITALTAETAIENVDKTIGGIHVGGEAQGQTPFTATLAAGHGALTLATASGLTVTGNGSGLVTLSGSIADLNVALTVLVYRGSPNYIGPDTLNLTAYDGNHTTQGSVSIDVEPVPIPFVTVTAPGGVYNGLPRGVTAASVLGTGNTVLASFGDPSLSYTYYVGATVNGAGIVTAPKGTGVYTVVAHWTSNNPNYTDADSLPVTFFIAPAPLVVTGITANKVYDATTHATLNTSGATLVGVIGSDVVLLDASVASAAFASRHVGSALHVSVSELRLSGPQASDYALTQPSISATISPAPLMITAATNTKPFDGTTTAAATPTVAGLLGTDTATGLTEAYSDPKPGTGKTLLVTGYIINDGNDGNDYLVTVVPNRTGVIVPYLAITTLSPTPTGFTVTFNKPFDPAKVTMYGLGGTVQDVTLVGAKNGSIDGSLIIDPSNTAFTFKATATVMQFFNGLAGAAPIDVLPDDTYSVRIVSGSGSNGFMDTLGAPLDGAVIGGNGGHADFATTFATHFVSSGVPVLGMPDFARGPDDAHPVKVPNNTASGIPVTLYNANSVTDATFTLTYDATLLSVTSGGTGDAPAGSTLTLVGTPNTSDPTDATATFHYASTTPWSGTLVLGDIIATVPSSAKTLYKQKQLLTLSPITLNGAAFSGVSFAALHVNAYFGDSSGDGAISAADVNPMFVVSLGKASGFFPYSLMDPAIVGDVAGNVVVDGGSVALLKAYILRLPRPVIPTPPGLVGIIGPNAADPTLSLEYSSGSPATLWVTVDHPHPEGSTGLTEAFLALHYDPAALSVSTADITLGSLTTGWQLRAVVDQLTGEIGIELFSDTPLTANESGSLIRIAFRPLAGVAASTSVRLVDNASPHGEAFVTMLADSLGSLLLSTGVDQIVVPVN